MYSDYILAEKTAFCNVFSTIIYYHSIIAENYSYKIACGSDLIACFEDTYKASLEDFFSCWLEGKVIIN